MFEHVAHSVVRRGLSQAPTFVKRASEEIKIDMPAWGSVLLAVTFFVSFVFLSAVQYTLKDVLPTLAMVETPAAAITVSHHEEPASKGEKEGLIETGPTITLVHQKPITSTIRGTIRHLVAEAGKFARWRGIRYHALYAVVLSWTTTLLEAYVPRTLPLRMVLIAAAGGAITANLHAAWTHKVISTPSDVSFWSRIPSRSSWKSLALPAAISSAMPIVSLYLGKGFISLFHLESQWNHLDSANGGQITATIAQSVFVLILSIACTLFLCMPAIVTQIRVEASMLPEDQDTIVPFDRTFGGKVVAKVLGGTGCVGFMDAWRSFNWEARRRLIKLYVKTFAIMMGISFIVLHIFVFEMFAIMGPKLGEFLAEAKRQGMLN